LAALSGDLTALKKQYGNDIEVADPSLTDAEIAKLKDNFSYLQTFELPNVDALGEQEVVSVDDATEELEGLTEKEMDTIEEKPQPAKRGRKPKTVN